MLFNFKKYLTLALFAPCFVLPLRGEAADSLSVEIGSGNKTQKATLGIQWNWSKRWWDSNGTHIGGYWDLNFAYWHGNQFHNISNRSQNIGEAGITPVFRLQNNAKKGLYGEVGVGIHMLSDRYNNNGRQLSTKFQFGDHLGIGYVFQNNAEIGVKLQHFSNASVKKPNDGVNFAIVKFSYPI